MAEEDWLSKYEKDFQDGDGGGGDDDTPKPQKRSRATTAAVFEEDEVDGPVKNRNNTVKMQFTNPVSKLPSNTTIYPRAIKDAAHTLLAYEDYPFAHSGQYDAFQTLLSLITTQPDDAMRVNPFVALWYVCDTGVSLVYFREVVRLSEYLLLLALHATFTLQITKTARVTNISIDDISVKAAFSDEQSTKASTLHVQEVLASLEIDPDVVDQVHYHMETLGPRDPAEVCDPDFVSAQQQVVSEILQGLYTAAQSFKPKRRQ